MYQTWMYINLRVEILLVASFYSNQAKIPPDEPIGSYADFVSTNFKTTIKQRTFLNVSFFLFNGGFKIGRNKVI